MSLFFLASDSHSSSRVIFGKSKWLCALILISQNWKQRVQLIYPVIKVLDSIWEIRGRTCGQLLQERLVPDGHNKTIYISSFSEAISVLWQLLPATICSFLQEFGLNDAIIPLFLCFFSYNTNTLHFPAKLKDQLLTFSQWGWNGNSPTWHKLCKD